ncbi:unnamed protein product [Rotaria sp. Silwood2]|nr:unnamed protein product [Rotaria sp. Silwood2]CAF3466883.1 unnamed protein product [Rotaria sp. Silwood2]CAF4461990.1 unnamed protein product [Rotaria sp. Silwood2]CAF4631135.1 unnamed protein product [Rotaria sp. Silwood2]
MYAIQIDNGIYIFDRSQIVRIQFKHETFVFNSNNANNQYVVLVISQNNSYQIPATYDTPNINLPTFVFELPLNGIISDFSTDIVIALNNKIVNRSIEDATLQLNYFDTNHGNKSSVMLNIDGGRYYVPLPTNDTIIDYYFDTKKLRTTIIQQSNACIKLIQAYPISNIWLKVPDSIKAFCLLIAAEITLKI